MAKQLRKKNKQQSSNQAHQIRIIAGRWRGQKIEVIDQQGLRPTTDRVRETVFNWLALPIVNAECLDAFAGSAALSFEALSRDASSVEVIEQSTKAAKAIEANARRLNAGGINLMQQNALAYLQQTTKAFDVVFLDPPFDQPILFISALKLIHQRNLLKKKGLIYIEMAKKDLHMLDTFEPELNWLKKKTAGQVCYALVCF